MIYYSKAVKSITRSSNHAGWGREDGDRPCNFRLGQMWPYPSADAAEFHHYKIKASIVRFQETLKPTSYSLIG